MDTMVKRDFEIVEDIFSDDNELKVVHQGGFTRREDDFIEALESVLDSYEDKKEEIDGYKEREDVNQRLHREMLKHINKLERMLNNREVVFKDWDETEEEFLY